MIILLNILPEQYSSNLIFLAFIIFSVLLYANFTPSHQPSVHIQHILNSFTALDKSIALEWTMHRSPVYKSKYSILPTCQPEWCILIYLKPSVVTKVYLDALPRYDPEPDFVVDSFLDPPPRFSVIVEPAPAVLIDTQKL
jgi:hypothetical protein